MVFRPEEEQELDYCRTGRLTLARLEAFTRRLQSLPHLWRSYTRTYAKG